MGIHHINRNKAYPSADSIDQFNIDMYLNRYITTTNLSFV